MINRRAMGGLAVAAAIGGVILMTVVARAGTDSANVAATEDNWVEVQSADDISEPEPTSYLSPDGSQAGIDHPQRGGDHAPVTIVEYSDFQCPYCRQEESLLRRLLNTYGDQVRLVYMDYPLPSHPRAMEAAMAARCADEQGKFWAYHDALFASSSALSTPELKAAATQLGLDSATFDACLDQHKYKSAVLADITEGEKAGAQGTPYFVIGGRSMNGPQPLSAIESAIDDQLRSQKATTAGAGGDRDD
jgi:protein-disulfide isomerase